MNLAAVPESFERCVAAIASIFAALPEPAVVADRNGVLVFANVSAREHFGQRLISERFSSALPDEVQAAFAVGEAAVLQSGECARIEWTDTVLRRSFHGLLCPVRGASAAVEGYLALCFDVTTLKETEIRLRQSEQLMVDTQGTAHLGTWEWDLSRPTATWSAELFRIYGLSPESYTPSYEAYLEMVHPDDRQRVAEATERVFREQIPYSHDERIFRPDGEIRYLHTWAHPVTDDDGKLVRLVGVCQDVTDRRLAEEQVRQLNVDLERRVRDRTLSIETSMRDLEAFNAMVSHDLRAPLAVIQTTCGLIRRSSLEALPADLRQNLERIERAVGHMTALVNHLLTLAHVGNSALERTEIDASAMCEELLANLRRAQPERSVETRVEPGIRLRGDAVLVRTMLQNILGNAWKYSSRAPLAIIEVGAFDANLGRGIFVRDNGAGFDMSEAHRLFLPFERLHKASEFKGTGVGLAAAHRIVERHGGRIWAESTQGEGTTFFIELSS